MKVAGPQTVNRSELTAILYALRVARVDQPLILYTDCKVSLDKIRAWVL
jgi:ribonuclease HI